jgi:pyruvate kinase
MRRTKIVCTLGPATSSEEMIRTLVRAGMDVVRLNFSHGTQESHGNLISLARRVAAEEGAVLAILQDLQGPRIRVGQMAGGSSTLTPGSRFVLTMREVPGTSEVATIGGAPLPQDVKPGDRILLDDGLIEMKVEQTTDTDVVCTVVIGGELKSSKGINVPGRTLSVPTITEKDREDLAFGLRQGVDYVAVSFVRAAEDVRRIREIVSEHGSDVPVMSKIEKHEAITNFDEILEASDAVMVARGDLGIEMPAEEVPLLQKMIIRKCNAAGKPVVTATQMLDSMIRNPRPTRAEVNDVANAILDGSDAVMLSGETAVGAYPVVSVQTMARIAETTDESIPYDEMMHKVASAPIGDSAEAIGHATCEIAYKLGIKAIITSTQSGYTTRMVSRYRPPAIIIAATPYETTLRRLAVVWGVRPYISPGYGTTDEMMERAIAVATSTGYVRDGDQVAITAGMPILGKGTTNLLRLHTIGEPI